MERFDPHGARAGLLGLLAVQAIIGYEWLMSGMTKLVRGGFRAGLEAELGEKSEGAASWYRAILDHVVIPNAFAFGVVVIAAEIAVGLALVASAAVCAFRAERVGAKARAAMLLTPSAPQSGVSS